MCGKKFNCYHNGKFCSYDCYWQSRWGQGGKCKNCGKPSKYRYCSAKCLKDYWNKNDYHLRKKRSYWDKKIKLIKKLGGKCKICGNDDIRVLDINHINPEKKKRPKNLSYTWQRRLKEWAENEKNLELLCSNCHRIHTWEQRGYGKY